MFASTAFLWVALGLILPGGLPAPTPQSVALGLTHTTPEERTKAIAAYVSGCRGVRTRHRFRRFRPAQKHFETLLTDSESTVRLAAIDLGICFSKDRSVPKIGKLVADADAAISLKAMTALAHAEHADGVAPLAAWLTANKGTCLQPTSQVTERCIFAVYAIGQAGQHEPANAPARLAAAATANILLGGQVAKLREVSAVALSFVGSRKDAARLEATVERERQLDFATTNEANVISHMLTIAHKLNKGP